MNYGDFAWRTSRLYLSPLTKVTTRSRSYGLDRVPPSGGFVYAVNHLHWIDIGLLGSLSPRNINYVAKFEVGGLPLAGRFLLWHGVILVRRGESDREAVRQMRESVREGRCIGLFVEGTRQRSGVPGKAQPGAAMVALQESVPVVPVAIYGTQYWKIGNFAPCSIAYGAPLYFSDLPKNGRGYKEATSEIERRIHMLFDWLADVHLRGRPPGLVPPV